ncbi:MAG: hypothetical protein GW898_10535 [Thiomicrospira sp.]|nr:hypothetical protein [Thiomicrospira sp.]NCN66339.1 hypothetical protein [Thiomicrospira sp.]NCO14793.1 hypothetical protein [Thiomicrospira sp.]NCO82389.1 hypothetical protein [Thiomicrospira sp.]OIP95482.1 MAG: hypothetical protein AUK56_05425 [Thiomicrospira sp. CG2_30_44_34]
MVNKDSSTEKTELSDILAEKISAAIDNCGANRLLRWENRKNKRYYELFAGTDLLGQAFLLRVWGSMKTKQGGEKREFLDLNEIINKAKDITKARARHGYELVSV